MITLNYTRLAQGGVAPLTYVVVNTLPETCDCAEIVNGVGPVPSNGIITFQINFSSSACIDTCVFELRITDAENCTTVEEITVTDPCADFEVTNISYSQSDGEITFNVLTAGGEGPYIYNWFYVDDGNPLFSAIRGNQGDPSYTFNYSGGGGRIQVAVKDSLGCIAISQLDVVTCKPRALESDIYARFVCLAGGQAGCIAFNIYAIPCLGRTIDWETFQVASILDLATDLEVSAASINLKTEMTVYPNGDATVCFKRLQLVNPIAPGSYRIYFTVEDDLGNISNEGYITVHFGECVDEFGGGNPIIDDCNCASSCEEINEAGEIRIDLTKCALYTCEPEDFPSPNDCIDGNTVQILDGPYIVDAFAYYDPYTKQLVYIPANDSVGVDAVVWTADTLNGDSLGLITWNINLNCYEPPVGTEDLACVNCCETVIIDVLANDTPGSPLGFDEDTLEILDQPTYGTAVVIAGEIHYTAFCNTAGIDTFSYIVADAGTGEYTEAISVTVEIACAGIEQESVFCFADDGPVAELEALLLSSGNYRTTMWGYLENNTPLDNTDELDVEFYDLTNDVSIASATLLVGSDNHTPKIGTDDDWTTKITPYLDVMTLTAGALNSTTGVIANFNKRAFAVAEGYANTYDSDGDVVGSDVAIDIEIRYTVRDMTGPTDSTEVTVELKRIKANILEDTMYVDQGANPDGNASSTWEWIAPAGTDSTFTTSALDLHPIELASTWFSQYINPYCQPPGRVEQYSLVSAPGTELATGLTVDYTNEGSFLFQLNTLMQGLGIPFYLLFKPYDELDTDFTLIGNNSKIFIAYLEEQEDCLNSVRVRYKNPASVNINKVSKVTLKNFILY